MHNVSISSNMDAPTLRSEPNEGNGGAKKGIQKNKPNVNKNELKTRSFRLSALQLLASYQRHLVSAAATPLPIKSNIPTADGKFLKRKVSRASTLKEGIIFAPKNVSFAFTNPSASSICQSNTKNEVNLGQDRVLKCAACDGAFSASDAGIPETLSIGKGGDEICDKDGNCRPVFCLVCEEKSRATAQDHLITYVKALCRFSCSRLDSVNSTGAKDDTSTLLLLRRSIIGTLLPPLASALALLSHQYFLVEETLPQFIAVIQLLDKYLRKTSKYEKLEKALINKDFCEHKRSWQDRLTKVVKVDGKSYSRSSNNSSASGSSEAGDLSSWSYRNPDSGDWQPYPRDAQTAMDEAFRGGVESIALQFPGDRLILVDFRRMTQINESSGMQCQIRQAPETDMPTGPWTCSQCTMINSETNRVCQACQTAYVPVTDTMADESSEDEDGYVAEEITSKKKNSSNANENNKKERNELPWIFDLYKTISTVSGKFSASLITGPQLEQDEVELAPWLKCNLFTDGIDYD